jgi:dipeptidyl aminopeptidase/acylaminoacyl peptidase
VTLPVGIKTENLPFVLVVHGGPWARDSWGFNPTHQLFANRGYGVISVNFRGSSGLGKRWTNLGDLQWGNTMQQDLTDTVEWAVKQGYADKDRVAIYGGSYGGYAVLAGLAFTPDVYACGVDIVGPSHIKTLLQSIPPYWETMKKMLQLRVGDVENDQALNERISPLYHADKITKPLLIAQGKNDPRVKQAESDQIAKKLFANKHDVQYILYTDEGHGFARPANKLEFFARVEKFFESYLGGRALPLDESLIEGNSAVEIDVSTL